MIRAISFSFMILAVSDVTVSVTEEVLSERSIIIQNHNKSFYTNKRHIRFRSIQMEITKSQFRTDCVQKWLGCISARHVFYVFASVTYNAPVRVQAVEKFAKVNESPIL